MSATAHATVPMPASVAASAPASRPAVSSHRYRPDIDGLRTLAIVPVVLNHLGLRGIWGGYIGVDVFFVISGFLITGNIVAQGRAGTFAITDFYRRRILRIFPALFAMLLVTTLLGCWYMLPGELARYARSLGAATLFGSNVLFFAEAGYFEPAARIKPLLHTWSLAIEEQFYILWPLIIAPLARRVPRALIGVVAVFTLISFAVSVWMVRAEPSGAYYLLPARAWELSIGAMLAVAPAMRLPRWLSETLATVAIGAIAYGVHAFTEATPFPGPAALLPCGGAALLILTGESGTWVARVLSTRPFVFVGQSSYSLYLWHWPVIVFAAIGWFAPPTPWVIAAELALSFALAVLSMRWVERPFRLAACDWSTPAVLAGGLAAMLVALATAAALIVAQGLPQRFSPAQRAVAAYEALDGDGLYRRGTCFAIGPRMRFDAQTCLVHAPGQPDLLLLGDSHAAHLWPGLAKFNDRFAVSQATHTGCKPVLYPVSDDPCRAFFRQMLTETIVRNPPARVLLAARWRMTDLPLLDRTLADPAVRAAHPVLVGPVPQYTSGLPRLLVYGDMAGDAGLATRARDPDVFATDAALARLARARGVDYVSMVDLLCPAGTCQVWAEPGVPMQFDYGHFTAEGSVRASALLMARIAQLPSRGPGA